MSVGYQVKQNLKSGNVENLKSLLKFWVWESGRKIDPATGVSSVCSKFFFQNTFDSGTFLYSPKRSESKVPRKKLGVAKIAIKG